MPCVKGTVSFPQILTRTSRLSEAFMILAASFVPKKTVFTVSLWNMVNNSKHFPVYYSLGKSNVYDVPGCKLVQSHIIVFHVFERTSLRILATSQNMFPLNFNSNRKYFLIKISLWILKVRYHIFN